MADSGPIIGLIIGFVTLTLGLLAYAEFVPVALPFLNMILNSDISPFAIFLYGLIPFFMVFVLIVRALA